MLLCCDLSPRLSTTTLFGLVFSMAAKACCCISTMQGMFPGNILKRGSYRASHQSELRGTRRRLTFQLWATSNVWRCCMSRLRFLAFIPLCFVGVVLFAEAGQSAPSGDRIQLKLNS